MPYDDIYQRVVDTYKRIGSVKQTAQEVGTTLVRAQRMHNKSQNDDYSYTIACVREKKKPVCIALDGMPVMDDVGGIHGYIDFLETIHGDDPQEKEESREWAKYMGWTGRMNKPETVL